METFNDIAKDYDGWYKTKIGKFVDDTETRLALGMFSPTKGMKVLDAGCGTGNFSIKLARFGCRVTGIDVSDDMIEIAISKAKEEQLDISFIKMDIYKLDFPDEFFEGVFSMAAFEFIHQPQKAYDEMYRVLKPGGQMLIGTINPQSNWGELYLSKEYQENSVFKHASFMTMEELKDLDRKNLKQTGECLFIPPFTPDKDINWETEEKLSAGNEGGFICALWEKPV